MQKFGLLAWKLSELWSILCFGGHFVFGCHLVFGWIFLIFFMRRVNLNFHAKIWTSSMKIEWVMINFVFWRPSCFWVTFFLKFMRRLNMNFHAKFWTSSMKIGWVMANCPNRYNWAGEWVSQSVSDYPRYRAAFAAKNKAHTGCTK